MFRNQNQPDVKRTQANLLQPAGFDPLAEQLRREAIESWPDFSETLHQRILHAVGERRDGAAPEKRGQSPFAGTAQRVLRTNGDCPLFSARRRGLAALLAAACLLCAAAIGWRIYDGRTAAVPPAAIGQNADELAFQMALQWSAGDLLSGDDLADQAAAGFDNLLSSAGLSPRSGPLADDARLAADTLLRRLPIDVELAESP
jgi:hypothetical protein